MDQNAKPKTGTIGQLDGLVMNYRAFHIYVNGLNSTQIGNNQKFLLTTDHLNEMSPHPQDQQGTGDAEVCPDPWDLERRSACAQTYGNLSFLWSSLGLSTHLGTVPQVGESYFSASHWPVGEEGWESQLVLLTLHLKPSWGSSRHLVTIAHPPYSWGIVKLCFQDAVGLTKSPLQGSGRNFLPLGQIGRVPGDIFLSWQHCRSPVLGWKEWK